MGMGKAAAQAAFDLIANRAFYATAEISTNMAQDYDRMDEALAIVAARAGLSYKTPDHVVEIIKMFEEN